MAEYLKGITNANPARAYRSALRTLVAEFGPKSSLEVPEGEAGADRREDSSANTVNARLRALSRSAVEELLTREGVPLREKGARLAGAITPLATTLRDDSTGARPRISATGIRDPASLNPRITATELLREGGLRRDVAYGDHKDLVEELQDRAKARHCTPAAMQELADQNAELQTKLADATAALTNERTLPATLREIIAELDLELHRVKRSSGGPASSPVFGAHQNLDGRKITLAQDIQRRPF